MARDIDAEDEDTPAPESDAREKLKQVGHYAMLGFAPVVSIAALGVALFATGNHSESAQPGVSNSSVDGLNTNSSVSREELENLKFSMAREKSQRADERKKAEERDEMIIRNVTRLQEKLKITPTLEEQLQVAAKARAAVSLVAVSAPAPVAAIAPAASDKPQSVPAPASAPVPAGAASKSAAGAPTPKGEGKQQTAATLDGKADDKKKVTPAPKPEEKMSPQVKALKKAIEQYNKE